MAVYVDNMYVAYRGMLMCHMIADADAELHIMADAIGVARRWYQAPPHHDAHYDISKMKRELAVHYGAVQITLKECACMNARRRETGSLGKPSEAVAWYKEFRAKTREASKMEALG